MIVNNVVQCGPSRFVREGETPDGRKYYSVVADVLPYYGQEPKPDAVWTHQRGIAPPWESWEDVEARNQYPASIYYYRGPREGYPYQ